MGNTTTTKEKSFTSRDWELIKKLISQSEVFFVDKLDGCKNIYGYSLKETREKAKAILFQINKYEK